MFIKKTTVFFAIFLVMATYAFAQNKENDTDFIVCVDQHREHILGIFQNYRPFSEQTKYCEMLGKPLQGSISEVERGPLFNKMIAIGLYPFAEGRYIATGFLEDEVLVEISVCALADRETEIRDYAFDILLTCTKNGQLEKYSDKIKKAMETYPDPDKTVLLSLTVLTGQEKEEMLENKSLSLGVRARLGDAAAESELVASYSNSLSFREKQEMAGKLGFVGSAKCGKALAESLAWTDVEKGPVDYVSIKCYIIRALGKIYSENPLLTNKISMIIDHSDSRLGGEATVREYLGEVYEWAENMYGIQLPEVEQGVYLHRIEPHEILEN